LRKSAGENSNLDTLERFALVGPADSLCSVRKSILNVFWHVLPRKINIVDIKQQKCRRDKYLQLK
jgi:hypothetical protein